MDKVLLSKGAIKQNCAQSNFHLSPLLLFVKKKDFKFGLNRKIGTDVSGQDKTVLTEFQITLITALASATAFLCRTSIRLISVNWDTVPSNNV